jgi:hypothetical protein
MGDSDVLVRPFTAGCLSTLAASRKALDHAGKNLPRCRPTRQSVMPKPTCSIL